MLTFDRKIVESENLIADDASHVSLASRDSIACTALFDHYNLTEYYLVVAPAPIDSSCGSYFEVSLLSLNSSCNKFISDVTKSELQLNWAGAPLMAIMIKWL